MQTTVPATVDFDQAPCLTIAEFCERNGKLSKSFFHKLVKDGKGPRLIKAGRRTLIAPGANAEWRAQMEAATSQAGA